jgi:hypothetical protein
MALKSQLKPDFTAAHRTPDCPKDPQHHTNKHKDAAERFQNRDCGEITDDDKNDA